MYLAGTPFESLLEKNDHCINYCCYLRVQLLGRKIAFIELAKTGEEVVMACSNVLPTSAWRGLSKTMKPFNQDSRFPSRYSIAITPHGPTYSGFVVFLSSPGEYLEINDSLVLHPSLPTVHNRLPISFHAM